MKSDACYLDGPQQRYAERKRPVAEGHADGAMPSTGRVPKRYMHKDRTRLLAAGRWGKGGTEGACLMGTEFLWGDEDVWGPDRGGDGTRR